MSAPLQVGLIRPEPDHDSRWWWDAVAEHRLLLPRCVACERCFFPPQASCPHCGHTEWSAVQASGRGTVYSWVVVHVALDPAFEPDVPYTIVAAELEEGVRIFGRLHGAVATAGLPVKATFYDVDGTTLLGFEAAR